MRPIQRACACLFAAALAGAGGAPATADRVRWYETRGIVANDDILADWSKASYWSTKLRQQADLKLIQGGPQDGRARDALLSAISSWLSAGGGQADVPDWVFALDPGDDSASHIGARVRLDRTSSPPHLELAPFTVDARIALSVAGAAASTWRLPVPIRHASFPGGIGPFCDANVDLCSVLFQRLGEQLAQPGSRLVTVSREAEQFSFHALIEDKPDPGQRLTVRYLGGVGMTPLAPPADFERKQAIDIWLERFQGAAAKERLGQLRGFESLPHSDSIAMKYAAAAYFESGTRDSEADVAWPTESPGESALYTLRMLPGSNDVSVESLGRQQLTRCDLRRTPGFPHRANTAAMREWLHRRYPAIQPTGETPTELIESAQRLVDAHAGDRHWFWRNYHLAILRPEAAYRRLADTHKIPPGRRGGLKDFSSQELHVLECVMEAMGDRLLQRVRDSVLIRQEEAEERSPFGELTKRVPIAGHTFTRTVSVEGANPHREVHSTVVIYDVALDPPSRFVGGRAPDGRVYAYAPLAEVFAHEFGHVVSKRASLEKQFNAWIDQLGVAPFTRYAASAPQTEFFPEAFALYLLDPEWLHSNYPALYARASAYARRPPDH
jgi:hypothetical protein